MRSAVTPTARTAAALLALVAWAGLVIQFHASWLTLGSFGSTLASLLLYFTITTNLLVAIVFSGIAAGSRSCSGPSLLGAVTLYILLVGIIYGLLLHGLQELSGGDLIANVLLHMVTPVLVPVFWVTFAPKGDLNRRDIMRWVIYPIGYLVYALIRAEFTGRYPYPFINVNELGWGHALLNALLIAIAFLIASRLFIWLDSRLGRSSQPSEVLPTSK